MSLISKISLAIPTMVLLFLLTATHAHGEPERCKQWEGNAEDVQKNLEELEKRKINGSEKYNSAAKNTALRGGKATVEAQRKAPEAERATQRAQAGNASDCVNTMAPIATDSLNQQQNINQMREKFAPCQGASDRFDELEGRREKLYDASLAELNRCNGHLNGFKKLANQNDGNAKGLGNDGPGAGQGDDQQKKGEEKGGGGGGSPGGGAPPQEDKPKDPNADAKDAPCPQGFVKNKEKLCEPQQAEAVKNQTEIIKQQAQQRQDALLLQSIEMQRQRCSIERYNCARAGGKNCDQICSDLR